MGGGDQVDVVAAFGLQLQHHHGQPFHRDDVAHPQLADGVVLTEETAPGATGEKNSARAARATDRRLLPGVDVPTGHPGLEASAAETLLTGQAIDAALPGAEGARLQQGVGPLNAAGQLAPVI